ncbi:HicB family toxin-antitoxin system [Nocardioides jejuensis]|uniref:HicB family toxin-antitoxin system n=1 Tax=Nocardioides jejuensis TaxID=2502782 RepID=A0A4R1CKB4_9ACTN|nr:HicB family toxin-antitoxin system [Nocardioides jejuensis]TCJ30438.1 HicB family toxin-antitoxin system [Nocardioides jejuensis]
MKFDIEVTRDGRWWMVAIPAIDGLTQARRLDEVEDMARSFIALDQDLKPSSVEIGTVRVSVAGEDLGAQLDEFERIKQAADLAQKEVAARARELAAKLSRLDVPTRDIGGVLGVSHQRVSQLTKERSA